MSRNSGESEEGEEREERVTGNVLEKSIMYVSYRIDIRLVRREVSIKLNQTLKLLQMNTMKNIYLQT